MLVIARGDVLQQRLVTPTLLTDTQLVDHVAGAVKDVQRGTETRCVLNAGRSVVT